MTTLTAGFPGKHPPVVCDGAFVTMCLSVGEDGHAHAKQRAWVDIPHYLPPGKLWRVREVTVTLEPLEPDE